MNVGGLATCFALRWRHFITLPVGYLGGDWGCGLSLHGGSGRVWMERPFVDLVRFEGGRALGHASQDICDVNVLVVRQGFRCGRAGGRRMEGEGAWSRMAGQPCSVRLL